MLYSALTLKLISNALVFSWINCSVWVCHLQSDVALCDFVHCYFFWPVAEPFADARRTLEFHRNTVCCAAYTRL